MFSLRNKKNIFELSSVPLSYLEFWHVNAIPGFLKQMSTISGAATLFSRNYIPSQSHNLIESGRASEVLT